jgi:hypothetical protein
MTAARYTFEGQQLTVAEIRAIVPAISDSSIRDHIRAGRNTRAAMLNHVPTQPPARRKKSPWARKGA